MIRLPAGMRSDLKWEKELQEARNSKDPILWHLDFSLEEPLDEAQFLSLQIAVDYFKASILEEFAAKTLGVTVYRGAPPKVEKLEFLRLLLAILPLDLFLEIDASSMSLQELFLFLSLDLLYDFHLLLERAPFKFCEKAPSALLLPETFTEAFFSKVEALLPQIGELRICKEGRLNEQWEGVETLFFDPSLLSPLGTRMLQGFVAASGKLVQI